MSSQRALQPAVAGVARLLQHVADAGDGPADHSRELAAQGDALAFGVAGAGAVDLRGLQVNRIAGDADFFFGEQVRTLAGDVALARATVLRIGAGRERQVAAVGGEQAGALAGVD